jgi:GPH family glycoside/pentoside/hexuronide:cation symporter
MEKRYLSLPKKLAYGSGDFGSNFFYMLVSSFALIYMTDAVGMNAGVVGTLIMVSKLLDGVTDVFFGNLIDKTNSKMGKARPWMFFSAFPLAISMILIFAIPSGLGDAAKYVWFFIFYTCANDLFYTANNISYATMSALITKNDTERVSLGSFRYVFAVVASIVVSAASVSLSEAMGGGVTGWRNVAIIYAVVFLVFNSIASLVCKEIPQTEDQKQADRQAENEDKSSFWARFKLVLGNKYYLLMLAIYLLTYTVNNLASTVGVYYCQYVLGNAALLGVISMSAFVMIIGLIANPSLVKRFGMYKVNLVSYFVTIVLSICVAIFAYMGSFTGILVFFFLKSISTSFLMGSLNALVAEVAQNTYLKHGVHTEGMMFSCSSIGMKLGSGLGAGMVGWLLAAVGYVGTVDVQPIAVLNMIKFIYGVIPVILTVLITLCLAGMKVVDENRRLSAQN